MRPDHAQRLARRRVLELLGLGTAGVAGAVGCGTRQPAPQSDQVDPAQGVDGRIFHGAWPYVAPPRSHYNLFTDVAERIDFGIYLDLLVAPGGLWYWAQEKWLPMVCASFEFGPRRFVYQVTEGLTWSNGDPVTAADVEVTFWCRWVMRQREWDFVRGMTVDSEHRISFDLVDAANVLEYYLIRANIFPARIYGQFAERAKELFASGAPIDGPDVTDLNGDLQQWRPKDPTNDDSEVLTSGPFRVDFGTVTEQQMELVKNPDGLLADRIRFDGILLYAGETEQILPRVLRRQVDYATHGFLPDDQRRLEKAGLRIQSPPTYLGASLFFCMDQLPMFRDVKARQGFAYLLDRERVAQRALGDAARPSAFMAGISEVFVRDWLERTDLERLNRYPHDPDRAAESLIQAGWVRRNGRWLTPDGHKASFELLVSEDLEDHRQAAVEVAAQLREFGIAVRLRQELASEMEQILAKGRYQMTVYTWGVGEPHPYFSFERNLIQDNILGALNQLGRGMGFDLRQTSEYFGDVDIRRLLTLAGSGLDKERQRSTVGQLALVYNELLPRIELFERFGNNAVLEGVRVQPWPGPDDPIYQNAPYSDNHAIILMYEGRLRPVT